ncbi:MAG: DNA polymerase III subunit delta [Nitrospiraceae bacterium]|nr:DNA polymerase III subunit delta [Nitrospiraceae bacterium]
MSFRNFLDEVKKGLPGRNYILSSSEPFLHAEALSLVRKIIPEEELDFNYQAFDLLGSKETMIPFDHILDILNAVPFFTGSKFVVVENIQKLLKKDQKKLAAYLANPSDSASLILTHAGPVKKELKELLKGMKQIPLDISEREIPAWLGVRARAKGIELSADAIEYLIGTIGTDLGLLSSEVEKCGLVGKPRIGREDIAGIIEGKRTYNAFALIDAIRDRDTERAFRIYRVLQETEEPYSLLGALNWQYARNFAEKESPRDRTYYRNVFGELSKADKEIKSSGTPYPMELLLVRLLQLSKQR